MSSTTRLRSITERIPSILVYDGPWQGEHIRAYASDWERDPEVLVFPVDDADEEGEPIEMSLLSLALVMRGHPGHVAEPCVRNPTRTLRILRQVHRRQHSLAHPMSPADVSPRAILAAFRERSAEARRDWESSCESTFREALSTARRMR